MTGLPMCHPGALARAYLPKRRHCQFQFSVGRTVWSAMRMVCVAWSWRVTSCREFSRFSASCDPASTCCAVMNVNAVERAGEVEVAFFPRTTFYIRCEPMSNEFYRPHNSMIDSSNVWIGVLSRMSRHILVGIAHSHHQSTDGQSNVVSRR